MLRAHPQPAVRRGKHREHESAGGVAGKRDARDDAIAVALQASTERSHPDRAVAVFGHGRRRRRPQTLGRGEHLEPGIAQPHQPAAVDGEPDVALAILEQIANAVSGQAVRDLDPSGGAIAPHVKQSLADVRQPDAAAPVLDAVQRLAERAGQALAGVARPHPLAPAGFPGAAVGDHPVAAVAREEDQRHVEPGLAVQRGHRSKAIAVEDGDLGLGADPDPPFAVARQPLHARAHPSARRRLAQHAARRGATAARRRT